MFLRHYHYIFVSNMAIFFKLNSLTSANNKKAEYM